MKQKKTTLKLFSLGALAMMFALVACGPEKSKKRPVAPNGDSMTAAIKALGYKAAEDEESKAFNKSLKFQNISKTGNKITAVMTFTIPEGFGPTGSNVTATASVDSENKKTEATVGDKGTDLENGEIAVNMACTKGCEAVVISVAIKNEKGDVILGGLTNDFQGKNEGGASGKPSEVKPSSK